jgi:methionyl-tRNA formyltransferase
MNIQILVDDPQSWYVPYAMNLSAEIQLRGFSCNVTHQHESIQSGDILFLLSCGRILKTQLLERNKLNLVVHGSKLPEGRGFAPLTWEILQGRSEFYLSLIEAATPVDSGRIYLQSSFKLEGHELHDELKDIQAREISKIVLDFLAHYPNINPVAQEGEPTSYPRRGPTDSALDINRPLADQFNLLRVVDNERYPAYFIRNGQKYLLKIYKPKNSS